MNVTSSILHSSLKLAMPLLLIALLLFTASSNAFDTGNELIEACRNPNDQAQYGYCLGFVSATFDVQEQLGVAKILPAIACLPEGVNRNQVVAVFQRYASVHPGELHGSAAYLVIASLKEAFPCATHLP